MKKFSLPALAALATVALGAPQTWAAPATYEIDPTHTTVAFFVNHIGFADTLGVFREVAGSFEFDPEAKVLGDVRVTVDAASVWTNDDRRDEHVRNADFLDVGTFPEIVFTASGGEVTGENTGRVTGDLTILGQTHPITLDVTLNKIADYPFGHGKETLGISIRGTVVRSQYGMSYAIPGGLVGDEVDLMIEFEAIRAD